jgi:glucose/arabinose dehydrogenase
MTRCLLLLSVAALTALFPIAALPQAASPPATLGVQMIASGFEQPLLVTAPAGDPRLFVVDQPGRIFIVKDGKRLETPFLDLRSKVAFDGERGLLGLAFHPDYKSNGRFFVDYTDKAGDTQIVAFKVSADADRADAPSATTLLSVKQPAANHNGGWVAFGPDGYLYIGMGDGGGGGDTYRNGQNKNALLGKILRIDVNGSAGGKPYAIPPANPFAKGGGAPEIFTYGMRNPWRNDFDGRNLYIADVGQNAWEEIDVIPIDGGSPGNALNLGWPIMEGTHCYGAQTCDQKGLVLPVYEYSHAGGACSITGGYVYRGLAIPALAGQFVFADYCAGFVRSLRYDGKAAPQVTDWSKQIGNLGQITSFGRDSAGELYITSQDGRVFKIVSR